MRTPLAAALVGTMLAASVQASTTVTYSGWLGDAGNPALVASDLSAPLFGNGAEVANNVALLHLSVADTGLVRFDSHGFAAGGADPYFTLFAGADGAATVLGSNYAQAFATGGDFSLAWTLPAGEYTLALGAFANLSMAENQGSGTLADGFIALGVEQVLGSGWYELQVTLPDGGGGVPEPGLPALVLTALVAAARCRHTKGLP